MKQKTIWKKLIFEKRLKNINLMDPNTSRFRIAMAFRAFKLTYLSYLTDFVFITFGIIAAFIGLKGFLIPNSFIDGGVVGISLLCSEIFGIELWKFLILINLPFIFIGRMVINLTFAIKTAIAIVGLVSVLAIFNMNAITHDPILAAVFGGFFLGIGIGLSVRGGAVIDGTEVLAIYLSRKFGTTIGDIITIINIFVFSAAAYFLNIEVALYSIITYVVASKSLDFVVEGIEEYIGVTIISNKSTQFQEMILNVMGRGVTIYSGKRGYGNSGASAEMEIIYTVITRLELNRLKIEIKKIDPNAFVVMSSVKDTIGGMIKKRRLKH